jgi:pimeloyl-ACP methyl ester carboxylesterase
MRHKALQFGKAAIFALAASLSVAAPVRAAPADLHPCKGLKEARCGTLMVFENRAAKTGRKIPLAVAVIPATGPKPAEPIFILQGGPGQAATDIAADIAHSPELDLRKAHDVVLVDQRGTGKSNGLQCPQPATPQGYFGHVEYDPAGLKACRAQLERRADLTLYGSSLAADDLDEVRAWLGYDKVILWGGSYGTKEAQVYMRQHPAHVAAAILDAVDSFGSKDPLYYAYGSQKGLERVFADCAAQPACAKAYPQLSRDFAKLLDRFRRGPLTAHIRAKPKASPVAVRYSLGDFGYTIRGLLYDPQKSALLPSQIAAAAASGNVDAFAQAYYDRAADLRQAISGGMYLSITCSEVQPYGAEDVTRWTAGTFLGDYMVNDFRNACAQWPRAKIPPSYFQPLESDIPTVLFSGERDPTTPAEFAKDVARHLSNGKHIIFPHGGHGNADGPCGMSIVKAFLKTKSVKGLDTACAAAVSSTVPFAVPKH